MIALLRRLWCRFVRPCSSSAFMEYHEAAKLSAQDRAYIEYQYRMLNDQRRPR